jgi:hypothetical protein
MINRRTGHIVDGHLRVELAAAAGEPSVPVSYVDLSEADELLVLVSLDPLAAMAGADSAKLDELLANVIPSDEALSATLGHLAADAGIAHMSLTDPDEVGPLPELGDVKIKPGDLFALGDHRLLCEDATNPTDVARLLAGGEPTLLVTDPPYGVGLDSTWRDATQRRCAPERRPRPASGSPSCSRARRRAR